jgi:3-dehydroquinate dehydratase-1
MQLCLSSAVIAAMPAFAAEVAQSSVQHYMVKNVNIGDLPVKTIVPITAKTAEQAIAQAKVIASNPDVIWLSFVSIYSNFLPTLKK